MDSKLVDFPKEFDLNEFRFRLEIFRMCRTLVNEKHEFTFSCRKFLVLIPLTEDFNLIDPVVFITLSLLCFLSKLVSVSNVGV